MSRFYNTAISPPRMTRNTPSDASLQDSVHGVYVSPYGRRHEFDDRRQQSAYEDQHVGEHIPQLEAQRQREYMRYIHGDHSSAGIGFHHVLDSQDSSTSRRSAARAGLLSDSPGHWDNQRDAAIHHQRDECSDATADRRQSRRDSYAQYPDHADIRSREVRLATRYAETGPATYIEGIVARDSLFDPRLSKPRFRSIFPAGPALSDEADLEPLIAQDGLSVSRPRPIFPEEPSRSSEEVDHSQGTPSWKLIYALDEHYRLGLRAEPGHRFDDVDDDIVSAYVNARDYKGPPVPGMQLIKDRQRPHSATDIWAVPISFLHLQNKFLGVLLPIGQETVADIANDILRVLYIHLSNDNSGIPYSVSGASVAESRECVLSELKRRGFTEKLPRVARLRGLRDRSVQRTSRDTDCSFGPASRSKLPRRSRVPVKKSAAKPDVLSKKKKGKAPVTRDQESDSSDHSSDASSSNTVQFELEVSSSQDSTPLAKGKVTPAETTCEDSCDCSKKTEHKIDGTTSRHRSSVSDPNSDY